MSKGEDRRGIELALVVGDGCGGGYWYLWDRWCGMGSLGRAGCVLLLSLLYSLCL